MDAEFQQDAAIIFDEKEIEFYGFIRNHVIVLQTFLFLYAISYYLLRKYTIKQDNDELYAGDEDFLVYRISTWMSALSLAVAIGELFLMPMTRFGFELMHIFPNNFYIKWLSDSLLLCVWNYMFFLGNLSLFVFLPFAYFFIESQGLSIFYRPHRPFLARVSETCVLCCLLIFLLVCIVDLIYTLVLQNESFSFAFLYFTSLSTPLLYSFVSLIGVFILLLSTPFGFVKMFDVMSNSLAPTLNVKPKQQQFVVLTSVDILTAKSQSRRQRHLISDEDFSTDITKSKSSNLPLIFYDGSYCRRLQKKNLKRFAEENNHCHVTDANEVDMSSCNLKNRIRIDVVCMKIMARLKPIFDSCFAIWNFFKYPVMMLVLVFFSILSVTIVIVNMAALLVGWRELSDYVQHLEIHSRHYLGLFGVFMEIALIFYIIGASFVGVYSLPFIRNIRPRVGKTSMTCIILNCGIALLLSSAVPVLARILGVTSFDLLGEYGRITWISDFSLVISYNVIFATCSAFCLASRFTVKVRSELLNRFSLIWSPRSCSSVENAHINGVTK